MDRPHPRTHRRPRRGDLDRRSAELAEIRSAKKFPVQRWERALVSARPQSAGRWHQSLLGPWEARRSVGLPDLRRAPNLLTTCALFSSATSSPTACSALTTRSCSRRHERRSAARVGVVPVDCVEVCESVVLRSLFVRPTDRGRFSRRPCLRVSFFGKRLLFRRRCRTSPLSVTTSPRVSTSICKPSVFGLPNSFDFTLAVVVASSIQAPNGLSPLRRQLQRYRAVRATTCKSLFTSTTPSMPFASSPARSLSMSLLTLPVKLHYALRDRGVDLRTH